VGVAFPLDHPEAQLGRYKDEIELAWRAVLRRSGSFAHHIKYEYKCNIVRFKRVGSLRDTMLRHKALDENVGHKLEEVAEWCGISHAYKEEYAELRKSPKTAPLTTVLRYNALDAITTLCCAEVLDEKVEEEGMEHVVHADDEFARCLSWLEIDGMKVDEMAMRHVQEEAQRDLDRVGEKLREHKAIRKTEKMLVDEIKSFKAGDHFNPNSPTQVKYLVLRTLKIKTKKVTQTGAPSLDKGALEKLADKHPVMKQVAEYRSLSAMITGFLKKYRQFMCSNGCVHSSYNQEVVVTGRLSSSDPNLQNIPKESVIRKVFVSRYEDRGWLINADARQQEPRLVAGIAQEDKMIEALAEGLNLHRFVASEIYLVPYDDVTDDQYYLGKRMNLGIIYGQTEYGLAEKTGKTVEEAADMLADYGRRFPKVERWRKRCHKMVAKQGWIEDIFGGRRHLPGARSPNEWERNRAFRQASNFVIQRTANIFNMLSFAVAQQLFLEVGLPSKVVGLVHDSLVSDTRELERTLRIVKHAMTMHNTQPYWRDMGVPMFTDISHGRNLYDMKPVPDEAIPDGWS
jgi:DNA polymerase-1